MGDASVNDGLTAWVLAFSVATGGAVGALGRWAISMWVHPIALSAATSRACGRPDHQRSAYFPLPTFLANLLACAVLGLVARTVEGGTGPYALLGVGVCGGLSTYSTFALEMAALVREQHRLVAFVYLASSLIGGLLIFALAAGLLL